MSSEYSNVKVYTVNGATAGSSSSLPDWLTRKRAAAGKGKRAVREQVEGTIELIQGFEFPEASNRIKTTRDGHHVIATGTYKPQIRVWDLDQLTLKFERHSDAENVDFVVRELFPYTPLNCEILKTGLPSACLTIGQSQYTSKTTAASNSIHKEASTIVLEYHVLVVHWPTTSHLATRISLPQEMKSTDSASTKDGS